MNTIFLSLPNYTTENLEQAVAVIRKCQKDALPDFNFPCPFIAPGGAYGGMWWQLDYSLALTGLLWFDPDSAVLGIRNFSACQKEDGRIPLWGNDTLPDFNGERLQRNGTSSLPKLFDAVGKILRRTRDEKLLETGYALMKRYLEWWIAARFDENTGLFSAVFEETFIPYYGFSGEYAPVDLNMELVHGFFSTADVAARLGKDSDAARLRERGTVLAKRVDSMLWNDEEQFFLPLDLKMQKHLSLHMASAFSAMRYNAASPEHVHVLLDILTDPARFNWNRRGLTTMDMTDRAFTLTSGPYQGNPSWSGSVWTLTNENAIRGLLDCGQKELAAELLIHTLDLFKRQYCEFLNPATGEPCGVMDYAWTASTCIELIFSVLFGIKYDACDGEISIDPVLPSCWDGQTLNVDGLPLPDRSRLHVSVKCAKSPEITAKFVSADGTVRTITAEGKCTLKI